MKYLGMAIGVCLACSGAFAKDKAPGPNEITMAAVSAHMAWGKPLRGGPIRVVCIAPRYTLRDAVELAERLDIDLKCVPLWDAAHAGCDPSEPERCLPGATAEETWQRLKEFLGKPFDVLIAANFDLGLLPADIQNTIADKIGNGRGLLLAYHDLSSSSPLQTLLDALEPDEDAKTILHGTVFSDGAGEDQPALLTTAQIGEGRVVQFHYDGDPPKTHCLVPGRDIPDSIVPDTFEDAYSLVARAVRWAAGRNPAAAIGGIMDAAPAGPSQEEIPPDLPAPVLQSLRDSVLGPATRPFRLELRQPADRDYHIMLGFRRPGAKLESSYVFNTPLPKGASEYAFELPIGIGTFSMDAWISDKKGVVDWFTQSVAIPGWPDFSNLSIDKEAVLPNDTIEIGVDVRSILSESRSCTIYARALDSHTSSLMPEGRLVSEAFRTLSHRGGHAELQMNFADLLAPLLRIEVFAFEGDVRSGPHRALNQAYREVRYVPVRLPRRENEMNLVAVPPISDELNARAYLENLTKSGVTMIYGPDSPETFRNVAVCGSRLLPEFAQYAVLNAQDGKFRVPCLNDPKFRREEAERIKEEAQSSWVHGAALYSLGIGNALVASDEFVCGCGDCLDGFRTYLQKKGVSLATLNAAWNTSFPNWEDVVPSIAPSTETPGALASFLQFRLFMNDSFASFHGFMRESIKAVNRDAQVGIRALPGDRISYAYDWAALLENLDYAAVDPEPITLSRIRSYRRPGAPMAMTFGDSFRPTPLEARGLPWYAACLGFPALWAMNPFGDRDQAAPEALILPDGRMNDTYSGFFESVREVSSGLGALLCAATPQTADIAIYESPVNNVLNAAEPAFKDTCSSSAMFLEHQLERSGFGYDYVDKERLIKNPGKYRVLILPTIRLLDNEEAEAIRAFSGRGGWIIADILPGTYDDYGRKRSVGPLDDLFGVEIHARQSQALTAGNGMLEGDPGVSLPGIMADASVAIKGGAAAGQCGEIPLWIQNHTDKGGALLLNFAPLNNASLEHPPQIFTALAAYMRSAGCLPVMDDLDDTGPFMGKRFRYQYGTADIRVWLPEMDAENSKQKIRFRVSKKTSAYDLRSKAPLKHPQKAAVDVHPGEPEIVALLPYKVDHLELIAPENIAQGQRLPIRIKISATEGSAPGLHLVALSLSPRGKETLSHYYRAVSCEAGQGDTFIPLALNESIGAYTLSARDLLSGIAEETTVRITPAQNTLSNSEQTPPETSIHGTAADAAKRTRKQSTGLNR